MGQNSGLKTGVMGRMQTNSPRQSKGHVLNLSHKLIELKLKVELHTGLLLL